MYLGERQCIWPETASSGLSVMHELLQLPPAASSSAADAQQRCCMRLIRHQSSCPPELKSALMVDGGYHAEIECAICSRLLRLCLLSWPRQQGLRPRLYLRLWPPGHGRIMHCRPLLPVLHLLLREQLQAAQTALERPICASTRPAAGLPAARAGQPRCLLQTAAMLLALLDEAGRTGAQLAASRELRGSRQ